MLGIDEDLKTARRRLGRVQHNADLHTPTVSALAARNISQLADACDAGAATRYECLDNKPQRPRSGPEEVAASTRRRAPPGGRSRVKQIRVGNRPRISSPPAGRPMRV
jgi:hypothetical protein